MTVVEDKQEYRKQLNIVKNEANGETVRKEAFASLEIVYSKIINKEPKCEIETPQVIRLRYIDKLDIPKVMWTCDFSELDEPEKRELTNLEKIRKLAYKWVRSNHPLENDQTDKFGQIVNARMNLIILSRQ